VKFHGISEIKASTKITHGLRSFLPYQVEWKSYSPYLVFMLMF